MSYKAFRALRGVEMRQDTYDLTATLHEHCESSSSTELLRASEFQQTCSTVNMTRPRLHGLFAVARDDLS